MEIAFWAACILGSGCVVGNMLIADWRCLHCRTWMFHEYTDTTMRCRRCKGRF